MREAPRLLTCVGVRTDLDLLPHWLAHFVALGVEPGRIHAILNATEPDDPGLARAAGILAAAGAAPPETWIAPFTSNTMWDERRSLQSRLGGDGWFLSADVDEFHEFPEPMDRFLARAERDGFDCIQGVFIDRLAPGGKLAPVGATPAITEQFPIRAEVGFAIGGTGATHGRGGTVKIMAMRGDVRPSRGGHNQVKGTPARQLYGMALGDMPDVERPGFRFAVPTRVHHYHWTAALPDRLRKRLATPGVSPAGVEYGTKQLNHIDRHGGIDLAAVPLMPDADRWPWRLRLRAIRAIARVRGTLMRLR